MAPRKATKRQNGTILDRIAQSDAKSAIQQPKRIQLNKRESASFFIYTYVPDESVNEIASKLLPEKLMADTVNGGIGRATAAAVKRHCTSVESNAKVTAKKMKSEPKVVPSMAPKINAKPSMFRSMGNRPHDADDDAGNASDKAKNEDDVTDQFFRYLSKSVTMGVEETIANVFNANMELVNEKINHLSNELLATNLHIDKMKNDLSAKAKRYGEENARQYRYLFNKSEYEKMLFHNSLKKLSEGAYNNAAECAAKPLTENDFEDLPMELQNICCQEKGNNVDLPTVESKPSLSGSKSANSCGSVSENSQIPDCNELLEHIEVLCKSLKTTVGNVRPKQLQSELGKETTIDQLPAANLLLEQGSQQEQGDASAAQANRPFNFF